MTNDPDLAAMRKHLGDRYWQTVREEETHVATDDVNKPAPKENTSVYEVNDKYVQRMYDVATWGQVRTPWDKLTENERAGFTSAIKVAYREGFHAAMRNVADHVRAQQKDA